MLASFAFLPVRSVKANLTRYGLTARAAAACLTIQAVTSRKLNIEVSEGECLIWPQITQSSRVLGLGFRGNLGLQLISQDVACGLPAPELPGVLVKNSDSWVSPQTTQSEVHQKV